MFRYGWEQQQTPGAHSPVSMRLEGGALQDAPRTPPPGSPLSGSKSDDDSRVEMWYMAPTPTHPQQETIMMSSSEEDA
jgi:hypothetical protein